MRRFTPLQKKETDAAKEEEEEDPTAQPEMTQDQIMTQYRITQQHTMGIWRSCTKCLFEKQTRTRNVVRFRSTSCMLKLYEYSCFATFELGQESCQLITCKLGYVRRNASSGSIASETTCCEESCHLFACPPRYTHKSTSLTTVGKISSCCEKSCALFICEGNKKISFSSTKAGTSANCCESTAITTTLAPAFLSPHYFDQENLHLGLGYQKRYQGSKFRSRYLQSRLKDSDSR